MKNIDTNLENYHYRKTNIIQILQDIQSEHNYLPEKILKYVSERLKMPLSTIYSIATFYAAFSLNPRGKHLCTVCMGTACHVRGAAAILNEFERKLDIKAGETTGDMNYSLETVNCLGCCAIGPIVVYDGKYMGEFKLKDVAAVLKEKE
ncbi:MAG: NAD(P)H-dependent oxidoreductase subunit E [candidate division WOR-3 bacterium]|nr:MAG: NAD(P)H-dependent oxidoreductase subunit E [candidate division WOR-3 bacterium]